MVGDVGLGVLRDRKVLSEEGVVVVIVTIDSQSGDIVTGPEIVTRGSGGDQQRNEVILARMRRPRARGLFPRGELSVAHLHVRARHDTSQPVLEYL